MSVPIANFASCLGKYDSTIMGAVVSDTSNNAGSGDISFNGGYILNTTQFVLPPPQNGNGISFSGWFYPVGTEPTNTALFDLSCTAPLNTGNIAVYFSASNAMSMIYNGTSASTGTNVYTPNTWNFFTYTVCCSGTSVAVQNLYVNAITTSTNPATLSNSAGTYTQFTVINTFLGFGVGSYNATKFAGKMDDFRFYNRVITPMEYRVLYGYNYKNTGANTLSLSFGTNPTGATAVVNTAGSGVSFSLSTTGTFAYFQVTRMINNTTTTMVVSASSLVLTNGTYTWTDSGLTSLVSYSYLFMPYSTVTKGIYNGTPTGLSNILTCITTVTALSGMIASSISYTGFTVSWTGGVGVSTYRTYTITGIGSVTPTTSGTGTATFTGLTPLTSWPLTVTSTNGYASSPASLTILAPPTAITSISAASITLTGFIASWVGGVGSNIVYTYTINGAGTGFSTSGTNPTTFSGLTGNSWSLVVTETNTAFNNTGGSITSPTFYILSAPSPISSVTPSAITPTGFVVNWSTDSDLNVVYSYTINGLSTGFSTSGTNPTTFTGLSGASWLLVITEDNRAYNATGGVVSSTGVTITQAPTAITGITFSAWTASSFNVTWAGGVSSNTVTFTFAVTGSTPTITNLTATSATISNLNATASWPVTITATNNTGSVSTSATSYPIPTAITSLTSSSATVTGFVASWSGGTSSSTVTYTYTINGLSSGFTTSGTNPTTFSGLTGNTWALIVTATNVSGNVTGSLSVSSNQFSITSNITNWQTTDVSGTSVTNGIIYNVYAFKNTGITYQLTYSISSAGSYIYVLAVGGGGGGGSGDNGAGGGGAGGLVMMPIYLTTSGTISIFVGAGGKNIGRGGRNGVSGTATTVTFSSNTSANINAIGGGGGGYNAVIPFQGGSSGGTGQQTYVTTPPIITSYNFGSHGGNGNQGSGGGGGACGIGSSGAYFNGYNGGNGGNGLQCFLPGIRDFSPSGVSYGTYFWGGGGGGGGSTYKNGTGGNGGGGAGGTEAWSGPLLQYKPAVINQPAPYTAQIDNVTYGMAGNGTSGYSNTGGGGGGGANGTQWGGSGGSGIVVIAFPKIAVTNNMTATLDPTLAASGRYNAVMNNPSFSTNAYNSCRGAFACRLLNYNYFGPIMALRADSEPFGGGAAFTQPFYADVCGNMGTEYLGRGLSVTDWIATRNAYGSRYAYVTKWYDQGMSTSFNSAFQINTGLQPLYDVSNGVMNFGYTGTNGGSTATPQINCNFTLPNGSLPYNDSSYTYILHHWNISTSATYVGFLGGGTNTGTNSGMYLQMQTTSPYTYQANWSGAGTALVNYNSALVNLSSKNVISTTYTSGSNALQLYVNAVLTSNSTNIGTRVQGSTNGTIGAGAYNLNGQMYDMFLFNTSLANSDLLIIENTPYNYTFPDKITGLTTSNITLTSFTLTWNQVLNVSYVLYVNSIKYGTVTSATTITPTVNGPYVCNLYAYSSDNMIIATGLTNTYAFTFPDMKYPLLFSDTMNGQSNDVMGTSVTNGITYNVSIFKSYNTTYTITYNVVAGGSYVYVLVVGCGGTGGITGGGGGGGGGVVMIPVFLPSSGTITIFVGGFSNPPTVTFSANPSAYIYANNGGGGGNTSGTSGGSSGGGGTNLGFSAVSLSPPISSSYNYGNYGGGSSSSTTGQTGGGGGGGAGTNGLWGTTMNSNGGNGGNGIQCFLPGIRDFSPLGVPIKTYYWGGGGGGSSNGGFAGNGGKGGGTGGGTSATTATFTAAIAGGMGSIGANYNGGSEYSGNGGNIGNGNIVRSQAWMGGGGGGGWATTTGSSGFISSVYIAYPLIPITNNTNTALSPDLISTGQHNAVLNNPSFSANAYKSIRGAFACRLLNYDYFGPVMNLRANTDSSGYYVKPFYADVCGNMGTEYLGTGITVTAWLATLDANTTYAYVTKWYNQGMDPSFNCAYQNIPSLQPIYDVSYGVINFGYTGTAGGVAAPQQSCYFTLPDGSLPFNDSSYTYISRHWNYTSNGGVSPIISGGNGSTNSMCAPLQLSLPNGSSAYGQDWNMNYQTGVGTIAPNNVITAKYTSTGTASLGAASFYVNSGTASNWSPSAVRTQTNVSNTIGASILSGWSGNVLRAQLYNLFYFSSALTDNDRLIIEKTPYIFTPPDRLTMQISGYKYAYMYTKGGTISLPSTTIVKVLIVAGGGGGGGGYDTVRGLASGGGGGGGVGEGSLVFTAGSTYSITVGSGGTGAYNSLINALNGGNSSIVGGTVNEVAYGGGYGGNDASFSYGAGGAGGSGGGGYSSLNTGGAATKGAGTLTYYGNVGGYSTAYGGPNDTGGGGGAGSAGATYTESLSGATGGVGYYWSVTGLYYGGGGGGGSPTNTTVWSGGVGGGGMGGGNNNYGPTFPSTPGFFYGAGGGGAAGGTGAITTDANGIKFSTGYKGSNGCQGCVIICYN